MINLYSTVKHAVLMAKHVMNVKVKIVYQIMIIQNVFVVIFILIRIMYVNNVINIKNVYIVIIHKHVNNVIVNNIGF